MTRRRQQPAPEMVKLFSATAMAHPGLREAGVEHATPSQWSDVGQATGFSFVAAGFAGLIGQSIAWALALPGYALQSLLAGGFGLIALFFWAWYSADSRRTRQWAAFDEPRADPEPPGREFVPVAEGSRTLVPDTRLRRNVIRFAELLPGVGYSLAYRQWTGRGRLFSRGEFDTVREAMRRLEYEEAGQVTQAGRSAIGRWRLGNFTADENDRLRSAAPAGLRQDSEVTGR